MADPIRILIASRSGPALERLKGALGRARDCTTSIKLIVNGHTDPLEGLTQLPDILVLAVQNSSSGEIEAHLRRDPAQRCPLIVVSAATDPAVMRVAMQAGARDFLTEPLDDAELIAAVQRISNEHRQRPGQPSKAARSVVFMNASGGSGATFLATSIAHLLQVNSHRETVLIDLDLQFGPVPNYLDVHPKRDLIQALSVAGDLDQTALEGYLTRHDSGLQILAPTDASTTMDRDAVAERLQLLHDLLAARFQHLVFDIPGQLDLPGVFALQKATDIAIVMQQSLPSLRNAARLVTLLTEELSIPRERMVIVINRFRKGADVSQQDIERALENHRLTCIPNHYQSVSESIAMGIPIYDHARTSPVVRPLQELEETLGGRGATPPRGLFGNRFTSLMRT